MLDAARLPDQTGTATHDLVQAYEQVFKPLVALEPHDGEHDPAVLRYFGFARPGPQVRGNVHAFAAELVEKPKNPPGRKYLRIAGRYILTPEIFKVLPETNESEPAPMRHGLTAAINRLWRASEAVLLFKLGGPMLSIAPYRDIIQNMDSRPTFSAASYRRHRPAHGAHR